MATGSPARDFPYPAPKYLSEVLRILADGAEHNVEEIRERILAKFPLTPEQRFLKRAGYPVTVFVNKVAYAFARLVFHNAIVDTSGRGGSYRITDHGRNISRDIPHRRKGVRPLATLHSRGNPDMKVISDRRSKGSLMPDEQGIERGVRLFTHLVGVANRGEAVGISYNGFIAFLHGVDEFREVAGRNYLPSDNEATVRIALNITFKTGGRKEVSRSGHSIRAGMDSFICNKKSPFDRPARAWLSSRFSIPYTREQWLSVFPDGARRLITTVELRFVASRQ